MRSGTNQASFLFVFGQHNSQNANDDALQGNNVKPKQNEQNNCTKK